VTIESIVVGADANAFPRNGAILVRLKLWQGQNERNRFDPRVRVVRVDNEETVAGVLEFAPQQDTMLWLPKQPLAARTQYRIEVSTTTQVRADIPAPTSSNALFTTAEGLADPALELSQDLRVALRFGTADIDECLCASCTKKGERRALYADVTPPIVSGGFDAYGYTAWVTLNDGAAPSFDGPGEGKHAGPVLVNLATYLRPKPGEATMATVELPSEDTPFNACFGFNVWDPIGQWKSAQPLCITQAERQEWLAKLDKPDAGENQPAAGSGGSATVTSDSDAGTESEASSGCMAAGSGSTSPSLAAVLVGLVLWLQRSRRRGASV
jgi:hypothetical protein